MSYVLVKSKLNKEFKNVLLDVRSTLPKEYTNEFITGPDNYVFVNYKNNNEIRVYYKNNNDIIFKLELFDDDKSYTTKTYKNPKNMIEYLYEEFQ